ncbi:hypothetical protein Clacol_002774 [Clathrus columnatus]|uniref:Protein phosphatase 1 regulatory subunit 7 n=1 Tax=Clathrus columnatus TaxID=1419009 RepID=A0AAV5A7K9_9AGAM|nr:hypothetical protein Clacol_002774 [Clathrus columnatus]
MSHQASSPKSEPDAFSEVTDEFTLVEKDEVASYNDQSTMMGSGDPTINGPDTEVNPEIPEKASNLVSERQDSEDDNDEDTGETQGLDDNMDLLADYPDDTEELELIHSRLSSCSALNLPRFAQHLKRLCLRQNLISTLEPSDFESLEEIEELDFYDNKIKHLGHALDKMHKLKVLDLSFNLIKAVPDSLGSFPSIDTLYFVQNKISVIEHFDQVCSTLRTLELGGNRIRTIENLDALTNLRELWLGKNKITELRNLGHLKSLKILSVQSNRITKIEALEGLEELEELYLSHNGIKKLEGLDKNLKLRTVDLGNNRIDVLENLSHLINLEELWVSD